MGHKKIHIPSVLAAKSSIKDLSSNCAIVVRRNWPLLNNCEPLPSDLNYKVSTTTQRLIETLKFIAVEASGDLTTRKEEMLLSLINCLWALHFLNKKSSTLFTVICPPICCYLSSRSCRWPPNYEISDYVIRTKIFQISF